MQMPWGSRLGRKIWIVMVCCSCSHGLRHQAPHIDLAADGGGDQGGAANTQPSPPTVKA
jgi:hypothetical protein